MQRPALRIISNFKNIEQVLPPAGPLAHERISEDESALRFLWRCLRADVVLLNIDQRKLMLAGLLCRLWPFRRFRLVSADLILRPPRTGTERLKARVKRWLFARVDRFILYFKNLEGYERYYGIGPARLAYVQFKVNGWERIVARAPEDRAADGEYVLCAGRTLRDVDTFVAAMRRTGCPGVLLQQKKELLAAHGTAAWTGELPSNLRLVVDEGDSLDDYLDFIAGARLVVIPRFAHDIAPTGISTYMVAMALGRCVLISEGPGAEDVLLRGQAVIVPPEDPERLAEQIKLLWHDHERRKEVAARGREYAQSAAGEQRLLRDILRASLDGLEARAGNGRALETEREIENVSGD